MGIKGDKAGTKDFRPSGRSQAEFGFVADPRPAQGIIDIIGGPDSDIVDPQDLAPPKGGRDSGAVPKKQKPIEAGQDDGESGRKIEDPRRLLHSLLGNNPPLSI